MKHSVSRHNRSPAVLLSIVSLSEQASVPCSPKHEASSVDPSAAWTWYTKC